MKTKTILAALSGIALVSTAHAASVTGWVTTNGNAGFAGGSEATNSPVTTDADGDTIAANLSSIITLADGDFITLTGSVSFDVALAGNQFRIGLFDGDNPVTAGDGAGYVGIYAEAPITDQATAGLVKSADGSLTNPFSSGAATELGNLSAGSAVAANTTISFLLTLARDGANLDITASYSDGGSYNPAGTLQDQAVAYYTYDSVAFLIGGQMNGTQATFSNIDVTYTPVPEPSAALLGLLGALGLLRRRRA